jgi:hypothetical protein
VTRRDAWYDEIIRESAADARHVYKPPQDFEKIQHFVAGLRQAGFSGGWLG